MGDARQEGSSNVNVQVAVRCRPLNSRWVMVIEWHAVGSTIAVP